MMRLRTALFVSKHRHGKGPANGSGSDEEEEEGDIGDNDEEEEGGSEESEQEIPFHITQRPIRLGSRRCIDYSGSGMTREVKRLRKIDPYSEPKTSTDPRFHTQFQQDFYESVILSKGKIIAEAQWVDWDHMERENDPMFNEIINACASKRIKKLMGFRNDWNKEIIAQFYATVYFGYIDGERAMFWMAEGTLYRITYP